MAVEFMTTRLPMLTLGRRALAPLLGAALLAAGCAGGDDTGTTDSGSTTGDSATASSTSTSTSSFFSTRGATETTGASGMSDSATGSTHKIEQGGQNADVIPNVVSGPDIMLGRFGNDQESDMFHSNGMSETGGFLAVAFRNGGGVGDGGGVLDPTGTAQSVRGVVTVELGAFTVTPVCTGDITGPGGMPDGQVDVDDLNAILGAFGTSVGMGDPRDLANNDGFVDVDDLNVVLSNWAGGV